MTALMNVSGLWLMFFSLVLVRHYSLGASVDYPEEYPDDAHLPAIVTKMVTLGRSVQVYVPKEYFVYKKPEGHVPAHVGNIVNVKDTKFFQGLHAWLYNHDEYKSDPHYIQGRLTQDYHLYTQNINEAMLCYPRCKFGAEEETHVDRKGINRTFYFDRDYRQLVRFEVVPKYRSKFKGCEFIGFFIEPADMDNDHWDTDYKDPRCITMAPYVHSVYYPHPKPGHKPWNIHPDRDILLTYFGSARKGRKSVLDGIYRALSKPRDFQILADKTIKYPFFSPDRNTREHEDNTRWAGEGHMKDRASSAFMKEAWDLYVNSIFSWQPEGDTPTRRAFYDSWMFGCIPVIPTSVAEVYKQLFKGLAFQDIPLEECVVVVEDAIHDNGEQLLRYVAAITHEEVETKRRNMRELAPIMQWGWYVFILSFSFLLHSFCK